MAVAKPRSRPRDSRQPGGANDLELYKLARAQIEHENTLVSHRITWFLTLQGFLFTAVFLTAAGLLDPNKAAMDPIGRRYLAVAIGMLCLVGIGSSVACFLLVRAAYKQIDVVNSWWKGREARAAKFPLITGGGGIDVYGYRVTGADFAHIILIIWSVLLALLIDFTWLGVGTSGAEYALPVCCDFGP
jgi:hypothetical protein